MSIFITPYTFNGETFLRQLDYVADPAGKVLSFNKAGYVGKEGKFLFGGEFVEGEHMFISINQETLIKGIRLDFHGWRIYAADGSAVFGSDDHVIYQERKNVVRRPFQDKSCPEYVYEAAYGKDYIARDGTKLKELEALMVGYNLDRLRHLSQLPSLHVCYGRISRMPEITSDETQGVARAMKGTIDAILSKDESLHREKLTRMFRMVMGYIDKNKAGLVEAMRDIA